MRASFFASVTFAIAAGSLLVGAAPTPAGTAAARRSVYGRADGTVTNTGNVSNAPGASE